MRKRCLVKHLTLTVIHSGANHQIGISSSVEWYDAEENIEGSIVRSKDRWLTMEEGFRWVLVAIGTALVLWGLDRMCLWLESRGWLYYRRVKPSSSSLGTALLELQSILEPSRQHVIEARLEEDDEQADSGAPPNTGIE